MGRKHFVRFKRSRFDRQLIDTYTYEQIISHGQPAMRTTRGRTPVSVRAEDLYYGRCAYCGRLLTATSWHWMRDEFGQLVKKCNNERACYNRRSEISEKAFRKAVRGK